jgi:hypothetical protein
MLEKGGRQLRVLPLFTGKKKDDGKCPIFSGALVFGQSALTRMLDRKNNMIRDDRQTGDVLDPGMLIDELWQTTVEAAIPAEIGPHCGHFLRAWNCLAIERMETEGRLAPEDLATAKNSLTRFVQLMKTEAVFLGHPNRLDRNCFQAAHGRLERRSHSTQFTLWPFWPSSIA